MSTIINFKCSNCDFEFQDRDLIFYIDNENNLKIESLSLEVSKTMEKSPLSGFLYENCCPHCNQLIRTFVVESDDTQLTNDEIEITQVKMPSTAGGIRNAVNQKTKIQPHETLEVPYKVETYLDFPASLELTRKDGEKIRVYTFEL